MKLKSKKRILFFLIIPFLIILVTIFYFNSFNKNQIKEKFKEVTMAEGVTIRNMVEMSGYHLVEEGEDKLTAFLDRIYTNESIIYIGLFKENRLIYLLSRYEGYFPVSRKQEEFRIFDTPMGKLFEITGQFKREPDALYRIHIGFDYEFLTAFETATGRNFLFVAGLFAIVLLFIIALIIYFDKKFFQKELELVEEKQEKERFKELSLLTAEIAHEIKNPLNSIYLSFNVFEKFCSQDPDALFYREAIKGEIKRISEILQSYSDLSREIHPKIQLIDIKEFSTEFSLILEEEFKTKGIDLEINIKGTECFNTDKNLLKQILLNLVKNAAEAEANKIYIEFFSTTEKLTIDVTDNGKGIEPKLKESIFKPYISTKTKGMGLGLHITRRLLQALNGEIRLNTQSKGKTIFSISLPVFKEHVI